MSLPLYRGAREALPAESSSPRHWGLWFDKFCDQWRTEPTRGASHAKWTLSATSGEAPKLKWLKRLPDRLGRPELLDEYASRMADMVEHRRGVLRVFRTQSRLLTGLGRSNPTENGFTWHPTLGVPYLPGSSVKGVIRSWAHESGVEAETIARVLGPPQTKASKGAGSIAVLDMLPLMPVKTALDVLTPHYGGYLQRREGPPGDWEAPVPVQLLAVDQGNLFVGGLVARRSAYASKDNRRPLSPAAQRAMADDLERVEAWLTEALEWIGAGAKTSTGYGRFEPVALEHVPWWRERCAQKEAEWEAQATPLQRLQRKLQTMSESDMLDLAASVARNASEDEGDPEAEPALTRRLLREQPNFALWSEGKTEHPIHLSSAKVTERARGIMTKAQLEELDRLTPEQELTQILRGLDISNAVDVLNDQRNREDRLPKKQLATLAKRAAKACKKSKSKRAAAEAFEAWVKTLPD